MRKMKRSFRNAISTILVLGLVVSTFSSCGFGSQHLEMEYEENNNDNIAVWDDVDGNEVTTWENATVVSWSDVDEISEWVYADLLFEDITDEMPLIDCKVFDYQSNGTYFDGEKVYKLVGDKFDVNSFVAKYAVGTGVIVICVVLNVVVAGVSTPVTCFIAGAADASVSMAIKGAAFGAATKAVVTAIKTDGDFEETMYGALEGSADGYMWGAIFGAATGGFSSQYCFTGETLIKTAYGMVPISQIRKGDKVYSYNEDTGIYDYAKVSQVIKGYSTELLDINVQGDRIISTYVHPFLTSDGWKKASALSDEDFLIGSDFDWLPIKSVQEYEVSRPVAVYSLCIEDSHTFAVGSNNVIVHNRCNPNEKYADTTRYFDEGSDLAKNYPDGVYIKPTGYPDFSPYATQTVTFKAPTQARVKAGECLRGDCYYDFKMANKAAFGINSVSATPKGYTWHHCEDGMTMQLIPTDLHRGLRHDGGEKVIALMLSAVICK